MITEEAVMGALSKVSDPELKRPLTELDMIKSIDIKEGHVTVDVNLTVAACPMKEKIADDISAAVGNLADVESTKVTFSTMTKEELERLKAKLGHSKAKGQPGPVPLTFAKRFIAVASGKGGVGKSTVTANLAAAMTRLGKSVGLLDADVYGFSIPRMLGLEGRPTILDDKIVPLRKGENFQVLSMGLFIGEDEPVIWRGPLLHKTVSQFLTDTMWDKLDYLLLDLPPGTGDVTITIAQSLPTAELLVVTTPQATATHVAGRVARLAEKTNLKVVGVIENMAYFDNHGEREYIFGKDGGKLLADRLQVPLLGEIPLMTSLRESGDIGRPAALEGTPEQVELFEKIARSLDSTGSR